jgi:hypothetical protein
MSCHPPRFPDWEETNPLFRSSPSKRRTTTGFVLTLPAMYSEVSGSLRLDANSVRMCRAIVKRVLTFMSIEMIRNHNSYNYPGCQELRIAKHRRELA